MTEIVKEIYDGVIAGNNPLVQQKVKEALESGVAPAVVLNEGMIPAMAEVGRLFEIGEYYVPEMLIAARAMQGGMSVLKPHLVEGEVQSAGKVVIGTVKGDLHDIGKNLVSLMMEGAGFEIIDLGTNVPPEKFAEAVQANKPDIICMSALLTTTMPNMKATIDALVACGVRDQVKVMIGGAPVTESYAQQLGADGFAPDASRAVKTAKSLLGK